MRLFPIRLACLAAFAAGCRPNAAPSTAGTPDAALAMISGDSMKAHARTLASDEFQGRAPGTHGDTLATAYIAAAFEKIGLKPGMPDGSFRQMVPFWNGAAQWNVTFESGAKKATLDDSTTSISWESAPMPEVNLTGKDLVFAGYGIDAPEVGWKDYKTPVAGKVVVVLYGEPSRPDPANPATADTTFFLGDELGWYGFIPHKLEAAVAAGAEAVLLVVDEKTSGIPWSALQSYSRERSHLEADPRYPKQVQNAFFINRLAAQRLMTAAGKSYDDLVKAANQPTFAPVTLPGKASIHITQRIRRFGSANVIGMIPGSDPAEKGRAVIYSAHWDHMGIDTTRKGDQIYNGGIDNAVGVAALLELAKAFKAAPAPPRRTVIFVATTAEEQLLLGAQYYVYHPVVPLDSTIADLDIDGVNTLGRATGLSVMGMEETTLGELLTEVATGRSRTVAPHPMLVAGGRYRTDRFAFARGGVPGIIAEGAGLVGKTPEQEAKLSLDYLVTRYHQVTDTIRADQDFSGAEDDIRLFFELGWRLADGAPRPQWKGGLRHTLMFGNSPAIK